MKGKFKPVLKLRNKLSVRLMVVVGILSLSTLATIGLMVFLNLNNQNKSRASGNGNEAGGNSLNTSGDIIMEFTWEGEKPTTATLGPDAIRVGKTSRTMFGGRASTKGLSPGDSKQDINLEITGNALFDLEGIDISIDYRRSEESGNFYTRGPGFNFGMEKGFLVISYRVEDGKGSFETVRQRTNYEVVSDPVFRTYRFIYNPANGKGEIFVNSVVVWSHQGGSNKALYWKNSGNIFIGKGMNGEGIDRPIFDNLVIRSTGNTSMFTESLINFMLEPKDNHVVIHWSTTMNNQVDYYTIERSINGVDFVNLTKIPSNPDKKSTAEYTYSDNCGETYNVVYYRLRQTFQNGKFVTHPLSAIRFKTDKGLSIETIRPLPFQNTFDVSYFLPHSGRVWFQLTDKQGNIVSTKTFDAPAGKNVHVFREQEQLTNGEYSLDLIFSNKKVSAKVIKG